MRSRIALERERNEEAIKLLAQGLEYNPGQPVLMADLANLHLLSRDSVSARPWVEQLMRADGERPENIYSQARLQWMEGEYEQARWVSSRKPPRRNRRDRRFATSLIQSLRQPGRYPGRARGPGTLAGWRCLGEMLALAGALPLRQHGPATRRSHGRHRRSAPACPTTAFLSYLHAVLLTLAGQTAKARLPVSLIETDERMGPRWRGFMFARKHGGEARVLRYSRRLC